MDIMLSHMVFGKISYDVLIIQNQIFNEKGIHQCFPQCQNITVIITNKDP